MQVEKVLKMAKMKNFSPARWGLIRDKKIFALEIEPYLLWSCHYLLQSN